MSFDEPAAGPNAAHIDIPDGSAESRALFLAGNLFDQVDDAAA